MTKNAGVGFREFVSELVGELLTRIPVRQTPLVVGLDGPDCSGKSTLTQALVGELMKACTVLPIHFDDFLNTPSYVEKSRKGLPERFREDYFDWASLQCLLAKLGRRPCDESQIDIILVEGLFLFERDRIKYFEFRIRLELSPDEVLVRALRRDVGVLGDTYWVKAHYQNECLPAQRAYMESAQPGQTAHCHVRIMEEAGSVRFSREAP